jgi:3-oxoacyl-[acyl-carrier protein] reductase
MSAAPTAIVTGASGSIGAAICQVLIKRGFAIVGVYRNGVEQASTLLEDLRRQGPATMVQADLAECGVADQILRRAREVGPPTVLVNNAGLMTQRATLDLTDEEWDRSINVNLSAAFRLCRAIIPDFMDARTGRIINISSQAAYRGSIGRAHYAAAKAGLLGFTFSLARELGEFSVTANVVVPGRIASEMLLAHSDGQMDSWLQETPLHRLGTADEVAAAVAFLASPEATYITGAALQVGGGLVMG